MHATYNRKDRLYEKAKNEGYRSRAAYKLIEIQDKYKILKKGDRIIDLGCFPGGWLQVAADITDEKGHVIGIDLKELEIFDKPLKSKLNIFQDDLEEKDLIIKKIEDLGVSLFDVIISDMSPGLTGIKDKDMADSYALFQLALSYCSLCLKPGGNFLCKVFPSQELEMLFKSQKKNWTSFQKTILKSSRNSSNELYVIGKGFKK